MALPAKALRPRVLMTTGTPSPMGTGGFSPLSPRTLKEIVKLELFEQEGREKCEEVWRSYHAEKRDAVGTTIPAEACKSLLQRAKKCPMMIFPVFKSTGSFLMLVGQFQQNVFLLTYLEEYRKNPNTASPWISIAVYDELTSTKGLGMLRADFMPNLTKREAEVLTEMLLAAYVDSLHPHTEAFNLRPNAFSFEQFTQDASKEFAAKFIVKE